MSDSQNLPHYPLPEDYELYGNHLRIRNKEGKIRVELELISRSFQKYDQFFQGLLSKIFSESIDLRVLDIGGGNKSSAVNDINLFYPENNAINIDPFAEDTDYSRIGFAESLPFPNSSFDIVISVNCLFHFLPSMQDKGSKMIEEAARVLKPDGMIFLFPGYDLNQVNTNLEQVIQLYNTNTFGKVYLKR
jgi:SAM-dependent methyltransferase